MRRDVFIFSNITPVPLDTAHGGDATRQHPPVRWKSRALTTVPRPAVYLFCQVRSLVTFWYLVFLACYRLQMHYLFLGLSLWSYSSSHNLLMPTKMDLTECLAPPFSPLKRVFSWAVPMVTAWIALFHPGHDGVRVMALHHSQSTPHVYSLAPWVPPAKRRRMETDARVHQQKESVTESQNGRGQNGPLEII